MKLSAIGSSTDTENPITVGVDIEFYDENGRAYDLKQVSPTHFVALKPE